MREGGLTTGALLLLVALLPVALCGACFQPSAYDPARCAEAPGGCDVDGDGAVAQASGGPDCDDGDASVHPEATEVPYDGVDQDCVGGDLTDVDGDGFDAVTAGGGDCDDGDDGVSPEATEAPYDGVDQDCSGGDLTDVDGDGHDALQAEGDDCDDEDPLVSPGAFDGVGDGVDTDCDDVIDRIDGLVGDGSRGVVSDGQAADGAHLGEVASIAVTEAGAVYFTQPPLAEGASGRVFRLDPDGILRKVAGVDSGGDPGGGQAALDAWLSVPDGLALDAEGRLYLSDTYGYRIYRIEASGQLTALAGDGYGGDLGDEGPATQARFKTPRGLAVGPDGSVYVADTDAHRVRRIDPQGTVHAFAGTGEAGSGGDDGPAVDATLEGPVDVAVGPDGSVYIADGAAHRVRRVWPDGTLTLLAGDGREDTLGDGGQATEASLKGPNGIAVDASGAVFLACELSERIRRVDPSGIITTAVGQVDDWDGSYAGDGGDATDATLYLPGDVSVTSQGALYLADGGHYALRWVDP